MKATNTLDEEALRTFIDQRKTDIVDALNHAISKLQKKGNRKRKEQSAEQGSDDDASKEADIFSQAAEFLRETPPEVLMPKVLFDKNIFSEVYKTPEASPEQRALFKFASDEKITAQIQIFREQYPNWKKARKQLMPKMEKNNNLESVSEQGEAANEEDVEVSSKKLKKKKKRKAADDDESKESPKKIKLDATSNDSAPSQLPKKKKKKKKKKKAKSEENSVAKEATNTDTEKENLPSTGTPSSPRKKKLNAIEKVVADGTAALKAAENSEDDSPLKTKPLKQKGPSHMPPVGKKPKFQKWNNDGGKGLQKNGVANHDDAESNGDNNAGNDAGFQNRNGGFQFRNQRGGKSFNNRRSNRNGFADSPLPAWKIRKFCDRNSPNIISVSPDWQKKVSEPKEEGEEKPSLLRPSWLTNPEEYKPVFSGKKNFRQNREPVNPNRIRVSSDWKNKSPKKDDAEGGDSSGTSLLKPSWLTNPEEQKPPPARKKFRGSFRGKKGF